ncbi:CBS domain-containing protein [Brevibacillus dissolubilis]|uniref:CBS domain-containing protein n=1 Tax=Brevibacillus dissolubilis TaxID=1844116 RepID=UPI0011175228|nr:CBS domain-containing protein [Brevibacillus dissolubilis]
MFIKDCLSPLAKLSTVQPTDKISHALDLMKTHRLLSMPVVDENGTFYGALSKRSLFELFEQGKFTGSYQEFIELPLAEGVDREYPTLSTEDLFEDALPIIVRYPFVAIVDADNKFLGILKRKDIELVLESVFGLNVKGTRVMLTHFEGKGLIKEITSILGKHNANLISIISFDSQHHGVRRILTKFLSQDSTDVIKKDLEKAGFVVTSVLENS